MATGVTPTYSIPFPLFTDPVDVHGDMEDLANRVEDILETKVSENATNLFTSTNTFQASSSSPVVRIIQSGAGNALQVEDASSDSTYFFVNADGNVGIGKTSAVEKLDITGNAYVNGVLLSGTASRADYLASNYTNPIAVFGIDADDYAQVAFRNTSDATNASTDIIVYSDNGSDNSGYMDMGITSSTFDDPDFTITGPNDGYIFMTAPEVFTETVTNKALTGNVATLTIGANDFRVGMPVTVSGVDATFNGTYTITARTSTTFSYAKTATNVPSTAASGTAVAGITGAGNLVLATGDTGTENKIIFAAGGLASDNTQMSITPDVNVHVEIDTPSTSPTTGAFTVVGGVGITGDVYTDGDLYVDNGGIVAKDILYVGNDAVTRSTTVGTNQKTATFKSKTSDIATITTSVAHGYSPFQSVTIALSPADAAFDGTYEILAVPTTTTFTYTKVGTNVASTASAGTVNAVKGWTNPIAIFTADATDYAQVVVQNINNSTDSSSDFIAYPDNGTDFSGYIDMGITSSAFDDPEFTITGPNDGYIFMTAPVGSTGHGNLVLATGDTGAENKIVFAAGGLSSNNTQMEITPDVNVHVEIDTPSTSPTTGALTVVGGVGILGDMNIQGNVDIAGTITFGGGGTTVETSNLNVTDPAIFIGTGSASTSTDLSFVGEYPVAISTITKAVSNKAFVKSTELATLTATAHTFQVGDTVVITGVETDLNGTFQITAVTTDTFTYKTTAPAANIASAAVSPAGSAEVSLRRRFFGITRDGADGIVKLFDTATTKPTTNVNFSDGTIGFAPLKAGSLELTTALAIAQGGTGATTAANAINALVPSQTGNSGEFLTTNGSVVSWATVDALPAQTGNSGKYLTTDGSTATWAVVDLLPSQTSNSGKFLTTNGTVTSWADISGGIAQDSMPSSTIEGQVWLDTNGTTNPTAVELTRWTKTVAEAGTTFTGTGDESTTLSYSPSTEQVYLNGVMLVRGSDYTASSGTSIVLASNAQVGDTLQVLLIPPVNVANVINNSFVNAKGDIVTASADNTPAILSAGSDGLYLKLNSAEATGLQWASVPDPDLTSIEIKAIMGVF